MTFLERQQTHFSLVSLGRRKLMVTNRGLTVRIYFDSEPRAVLGKKHPSEVNTSRYPNLGALRNLQFQNASHSQTKITSCAANKVLNVGLRLLASSPSYLAWPAEMLSVPNNRKLLIHEAFVRGFQVLSPQGELVDSLTTPFEPEPEMA